MVLTFSIGIAGGFAPPTPSAVHELSRSTDAPEHVVVNSSVRPSGQPSLSAALPKKLAVDPNMPLIDELHSILKTLPMEHPPGSEDIYGVRIACSPFTLLYRGFIFSSIPASHGVVTT